MHLDRVQLDNFGIYHQHTLDFGKSDLILLYGPNESGKTTSLNGLRQALFGFKQRSPYLTAGKTMQAGVTAKLSNGKSLRFSRRKGRQDDIEGFLDGKSIDATAVSQLLGNLDLTSYEQLFGFSLDELRWGEEALKSAQLSEALAGGGLAGINALQKLRSELSNTLSDLYKARGSRSAINVKLSEIQATRTELTKVQVLPAEVEELQREQQQLIQTGQRLREEHATTFQHREAAGRLLQMMPNYRRWVQLKQQLASIQLPEGVDMQFVANWADHSEKRKELVRTLEQESEQLRQEQMSFDSLGGTSHLSEFEDAIEQLGHQVEEIGSLRKRAIDLADTLEESTALCRRLCETLQIADATDAIRSFVVTPPQRRDLERISRDLVSLSEQQIACEAQLESAKRSLAALQPTDDQESPPSNLDDLSHRVKELEAAEQRLAGATESATELQQSPSMLLLEQQLASCAPGGLLADWQLPSADLIQQANDSRLNLVNRGQQLVNEIAKLQNEIADVESQLTNVDQSVVQKTLANLEENRLQRDQLFENWEDDLTQPLIAASITAEVQSQRLAEIRILSEQADQLQRLLMESAEAVAIYQAGQKQLERMQAQLGNLQNDHQQNATQLEQWKADWNQLWSELGIVAQPAERMQQWLVDYQRWKDHQLRIAQAKRDLQMARSLVRQSRVSLLDDWPGNFREDTAMAVLASRIAAWQNAVRDAARDEQRLKSAQLQVELLDDELRKILEKKDAKLKLYSQWLSTVPITQPWPAEQVTQLIETIEHLRREDETARKAEADLRQIAQRLEEFELDSRETARRIGSEIAPQVTVESVVAEWFDEVKRMRADRSERIRLKATIDYRQRHVEDLRNQKSALDDRLAALIAASGSNDTVGVTSIAQQVQLAEQLRQEIAECRSALEAQSAGQPLADLLEQLANEDEIKLRIAIEEFNRNLDSLDQDRNANDQKIGSVEQQIEQLAQNHQAGQLSQALQFQRSQLAELCEQWVVHRLAAELLDRAVDRFSGEHEPALLQYTRDFLKQLTGGRYQTVEHDSANAAKFIVRNASGEAFEPEKLSTGTREQLYLAIRMAFITHYCQNHEPLPVIMDDCFVNFDDLRTAHALRAIADWKIKAQRILLSCHFRVVQSLAEISPDIPCIHLQRDERTTVGELAGQIATQA